MVNNLSFLFFFLKRPDGRKQRMPFLFAYVLETWIDHLVYKFHRVTRNKNQIVKGKNKRDFSQMGSMALREVCWELKEGEKLAIQGVEQKR